MLEKYLNKNGGGKQNRRDQRGGKLFHQRHINLQRLQLPKLGARDKLSGRRKTQHDFRQIAERRAWVWLVPDNELVELGKMPDLQRQVTAAIDIDRIVQ